MKLFFIVGEDSGDALAAPLINSLNEMSPDDIECMGVGGPLMAQENFETLLPMDQISIIGIWEVLPKIPRLIKLKKAIVEEIEKQQPDAVITVDFPDFNFWLAKELKKRGIFKGKILHYVAPSVWAWRPGRAQKISTFIDGMMCLFPMEVDYFTKHNMKAAHVGHPLTTSEAKAASADEFREANGISKDTPTLGLFFGSRESEFKNLSGIIKKAASLVHDVEEDINVISPTLPKLEFEIQKLLKDFTLPVFVTANPNTKWQAMKACDVAIAVSGTVALELAYAGVPHVICYKINPITAIIIKTMAKVKHVHLANILLEKEVVPECLQGKCVAEHIAQKSLELLQNQENRKEQLESFKELDEKLGGKGSMSPSNKAAEFILTTLKS
ncbi:MAG: lipid-A-disaccharide synthase [Alcanivorax sp.]